MLKEAEGVGPSGVEEGYRRYYNVIRLAESKHYSTPIFHGELAAFRKELLLRVNGFPEHIGADDSHTASKIALLGYRAITPETLYCEESLPKDEKSYFWWRVRRAQHLIQHFIELLRLRFKAPSRFEKIMLIESYLHLVNPWLLPVSLTLILLSLAYTLSKTSLILLLLGLTLLAIKPYRTWIVQQIHLIVAFIRNLRSKEIAWSKQEK